MNFKIVFNEYDIKEPGNFKMDRAQGAIRYIFFHFISSVEITINGEKTIANPGAVILYTPNTPQTFTPYNCRLNHDYVDFELIDENFFNNIHFPLNTLIYPKNSRAITSTIKAMKVASNLNNIGAAYEQEALFQQMLINIARTVTKSRNINTFDSAEAIKTSFDMLRLDLYSNPTNTSVANLATKIGFSLSYFNRLYKEYFHIPPVKDLNNARLAYAKEKLLSGETVSNISDSLGFNNTEYFYIWFKKHTKVTPFQFIHNS